MKAGAIDHLDELRRRLLVVLVWFLMFFGFGIIISPLILKKLITDLIVLNVKLITLTPLEFLYTQIKIGFILAIALSLPNIIYHLVMFAKPALKKREIKGIKFILPGFILFFIIGVVFAYVVFLKLSIYFLARLAPLAGIQNFWSINSFISFILYLCLSIGIIFELPLVLMLLVKLGVIKKRSLKKYRPYVYVSAFIIAAIITPPDMITQIILALPIILLYELSLLMF